jgi:FKBP-type peptidyl-prolyl cis-trans isomerase SlyD
MKIAKACTAVLVYTLTDMEGNKVEEVTEDRPASFTFGNGQLLPKFEENLLGLEPGSNFNFVIKAEDAYGPVDPYAIFDIPADTFEVDGKTDAKMLKVGNFIPMTDNEGNKHMGKITAVNSEFVTMNFNHPLAGMDLHFSGKILSVSKSEKDIS